MQYENEGKTTTIGPPRPDAYVSEVKPSGPLLAAQNIVSTLQSILAAPAPVPQRAPVTVKRERLEGASERSTPVQRAWASFIRSGKFLVLILVMGMIAYVALPTVNGYLITMATLLGMSVVMLLFDRVEYSHSQPGVERLRTIKDHKLEMAHEQNRHAETMEAIRGDIEIKRDVLALMGASRRQLSSDGTKYLGEVK